ncbi:MAG: hypothetical protein N2510_08455, partial [Ignavibacteria bacterium]|nr:hypothetical protein [Ignavibacteria bacterium]
MKKLILLSLLVILSLNFTDVQIVRYSEVNERVVKRLSDGTMFEKNKIIVKLKHHSSFSGKSLGISNIDARLNEYGLTSVKQKHPLNLSKRFYGDEELSKIFELRYSSTVM